MAPSRSFSPARELPEQDLRFSIVRILGEQLLRAGFRILELSEQQLEISGLDLEIQIRPGMRSAARTYSRNAFGASPDTR